jgi:hypothetical protein
MNGAAPRLDLLTGAEPDDEVRRDLSVADLVVHRIRLRARRRALWLESLHRENGAEDANPLERGLQLALQGRDDPRDQERWLGESKLVKSLNQELERVEEALNGRAGAPLEELRLVFGLTQPELDLLQTAAALALDPSLGTVFAYLQSDPSRGYVAAALAARLFDPGEAPIWHRGSPLALWKLVFEHAVAPGEAPELVVDPLVVGWLRGTLILDPELVGISTPIEPKHPLEGWPVSSTVVALRRSLERGARVRLVVAGLPGSGRRTFAAMVATHLGVRVLALDTGALAASDVADVCLRARRAALLGRLALLWYGARPELPWLAPIHPVSLEMVAVESDQELLGLSGGVDRRVELPRLALDERRRLWRAHVPISAAWPEAERERLIDRHRLTAGDIVTLSLHAPERLDEAALLCRELTRHRLGDLARRLPCPFTWDDLVLPDSLRNSLEVFAFEARERMAFWESSRARRLFPRGTGLVALLSGPPGTGKTMAAQVIAADLGLDLFCVDLATVINKYIGETAKNLRRIFTRAAGMDAVLLFDEADALFSKRTEIRDAHDHYANADTSYLLQLLEEYQGVALLATNKKGNIDSAFIRRIRYLFELSKPSPEHRARILRQVTTELCDAEIVDRLGPGLDVVIRRLELTGAQIKNSVLAAIFIARHQGAPFDLDHLLDGIDRELVKDGRGLFGSDRADLLKKATMSLRRARGVG